MMSLPACRTPRPAAALSLLVALSTGLAAQGKDSIEWVDGSASNNIEVRKLDVQEIEFRGSGGNKTRKRIDARDISLASWDAEVSGITDPQEMFGKAQSLVKNKKPLLAQGVYWLAAQAYWADASTADKALLVLEDLTKELPKSAYAPDYFRMKIRYYLGRQKPDIASATKVSRDMGDFARRNTWPRAYEYEGEYWGHKAEAIGGKVDAEGFVRALTSLRSKAKADAPHVAILCTLDIADTLRNTKQYAEAKAEYESLTKYKGLSISDRTRMHIGLGYLAMEEAVQQKDKAIFEQAFVHFTKGFLPIKKEVDKGEGVDMNLINMGAECLFRATEALVQWGGHEDVAGMAGRLRGRLRLRAPWKNTEWAKRR